MSPKEAFHSIKGKPKIKISTNLSKSINSTLQTKQSMCDIIQKNIRQNLLPFLHLMPSNEIKSNEKERAITIEKLLKKRRQNKV